MMKKYYCPLSKELDKHCTHGGIKDFDYGFVRGSYYYCHRIKQPVRRLAQCPKKLQEQQP